MGRWFKTLLLALIIFAGAWLLWNRDQIGSFADAANLARSQMGIDGQESQNPFRQAGTSRFIQNRSHGGNARHASGPVKDYSRIPIKSPANQPAATKSRLINQFPAGSTIRIGSFKIDATGSKGNLELTADICEQFDVMAIQNHTDLSIARLVNELNLRGLDFRFVNRKGSDNRFAIIFNQQTVVLDEQHWYSVNDPNNLFLHEPLVAWFRTRNADPETAFTFTLANVQLNPENPDQEIAYMGELFRAIRMDGRGEDDVIIAGDFYSSDTQLKQLKSTIGLASAIVDTATNTRNDTQLDNIIFDEKATVEFTDVSGAFDFMKRFNMTLAEALAISNRMPVWAEFSVLEGQAPGRAAEAYERFNASR